MAAFELPFNYMYSKELLIIHVYLLRLKALLNVYTAYAILKTHAV